MRRYDIHPDLIVAAQLSSVYPRSPRTRQPIRNTRGYRAWWNSVGGGSPGPRRNPGRSAAPGQRSQPGEPGEQPDHPPHPPCHVRCHRGRCRGEIVGRSTGRPFRCHQCRAIAGFMGQQAASLPGHALLARPARVAQHDFARHAASPGIATNRPMVGATHVVRSTGLEMRLAFDPVQGFRQRQSLKQAEPFTRVSVPGQVKAVPADIFQAGKWRFEFRFV
jgi:hypothetical protein